MRLNRFLATAGLGSRRGVEELIEKGRVRVNGTVVTDLATKVKPTDVIKVGNKVVRPEHTIHAVMNKPPGYICTADDEQDRRTIYELLPPHWPRVFHVGRLDMESEGLLMITNDGDLSLALTHPKYKVPKEYEVVLDRPFDPAHSEKLLRGFHIIGGRAKMEAIELISGRRLRLVLHQGIKRQIRLMMYEMGYEVEQLKRLRIGSIELGNLPTGHSRLLTPAEVESLRALTSPAGAKVPTARTITAGFKDLRPPDRRGKGPSKRVKPAPREQKPAVSVERAPSREGRAGARPDRGPARQERPQERPERTFSRPERATDRPARPGSASKRPGDRGERPGFAGARSVERPSPRNEERVQRGAVPGKRREATETKGFERGASRSERDDPRFKRGAPPFERGTPRSDRGDSRKKRPDSHAERGAPRGEAAERRSPRVSPREEREAPRENRLAPRFDRKPSPGFRAPTSRARPPRPSSGGPAKPRPPRGR